MVADKNRKKQVRARMEKTGETYTVAKNALAAEAAPAKPGASASVIAFVINHTWRQLGLSQQRLFWYSKLTSALTQRSTDKELLRTREDEIRNAVKALEDFGYVQRRGELKCPYCNAEWGGSPDKPPRLCGSCSANLKQYMEDEDPDILMHDSFALVAPLFSTYKGDFDQLVSLTETFAALAPEDEDRSMQAQIQRVQLRALNEAIENRAPTERQRLETTQKALERVRERVAKDSEPRKQEAPVNAKPVDLEDLAHVGMIGHVGMERLRDRLPDDLDFDALYARRGTPHETDTHFHWAIRHHQLKMLSKVLVHGTHVEPLIDALRVANTPDSSLNEVRENAHEALTEFFKQHQRILNAMHDPRDHEEYLDDPQFESWGKCVNGHVFPTWKDAEFAYCGCGVSGAEAVKLTVEENKSLNDSLAALNRTLVANAPYLFRQALLDGLPVIVPKYLTYGFLKKAFNVKPMSLVVSNLETPDPRWKGTFQAVLGGPNGAHEPLELPDEGNLFIR